jgi:1,2-diacylglycerol 3-beta-galactosyltransferase
MVISVATPRRSTSIRDAVLGSVLGGGGRQLYQPLRCAFYDGAAGGGGGGLPGDGLAAALSEELARVSAGGGKQKQAARNVLILMSDTGGGHRASAEALRDAFRIEFGDAYKVRRRLCQPNAPSPYELF